MTKKAIRPVIPGDEPELEPAVEQAVEQPPEAPEAEAPAVEQPAFQEFPEPMPEVASTLAEIRAEVASLAGAPINDAPPVRRLRMLRAFRGALSEERAILPGDYDEDDPNLFMLAPYLVEHGYAEWLRS